MNTRGLGNIQPVGPVGVRGLVGFTTAIKSIQKEMDEAQQLEDTVAADLVLHSLSGNDLRSQEVATEAIKRHKKVILAYCNKHLASRSLYVRNLGKAFADGVVLIVLLEILSGYQLKGAIAKPKKEEEIQNNFTLLNKMLNVLQLSTPINTKGTHFPFSSFLSLFLHIFQ